MKIFSKFRDFYDTASSHGIDKEIVYVREQDVIRIPRVEEMPYAYDFSSRAPHNGEMLYVRVSVDFILVGFCGTIFPGAHIEVKIDDMNLTENYYCYSHESLIKFCAKLGHVLEEHRWSWNSRMSSKEFFSSPHANWHSQFHLHKTPIFIVRRDDDSKAKRNHQILVNPMLKNFNFQTVKDAYSAFQEIQMYVSGVLGASSKPMLKLSDKELAKKRGHDGVYSFRKPPKGKK